MVNLLKLFNIPEPVMNRNYPKIEALDISTSKFYFKNNIELLFIQHCNYIEYKMLNGGCVDYYGDRLLDDQIVSDDKLELVGGLGKRVDIKPEFGAKSKTIFVLPGSTVHSTDVQEGMGGWGHGYGHHTLIPCMTDINAGDCPIFEDGYPDTLYDDVAIELLKRGVNLMKAGLEIQDYVELFDQVYPAYDNFFSTDNIDVYRGAGEYLILANTFECREWIHDVFKNAPNFDEKYKNLTNPTDEQIALIKLTWS